MRKLNRFLGARHVRSLYFLTPDVNWVLDWVAHYVTSEVQKQFGLPAHVVKSVTGKRGQILHFGSLWEIAGNLDAGYSKKNFVVGTIFHGQMQDPGFQQALEKVLKLKDLVSVFHTASQVMEARLLDWGISRSKLVTIPLGVDLEVFFPYGEEEKRAIRRDLEIPVDTFCIGSFQKDGNGWEEGLEPKLIKGPDVFLDVIARLAKTFPVFVLLSGPARGYVKRGLEAAGIAYRHVMEEDFKRIPRLYNALDMYLLTSREEGGPQSVLESLACGVPFVGTQVGLVPDVITHGKDGLLAPSEDVEALTSLASGLLEKKVQRDELVMRGLKTARSYDWKLIAGRYFHEIYKPLLTAAAL